MDSGFLDLCVNVAPDGGNDANERLRETLTRLCQLGYRTVAVNQMVDDSLFAAEKRKKKKRKDEKSANELLEPNKLNSLALEFSGRLRIVNRITFVCSDPSKTHSLGHCASLKKYHLYAIAPRSQNALQFACSQLNADIITLPPTSLGLKINRKLYEQATERGLRFEIRYSDILSLETRKQAIYYSHLFHTYGKSRNVIITSGATDARQIRSPYDIVNLSFLLGLNEARSKMAILQESKALLMKAERRRRGKAIFAIEEIEDEPSQRKRIKHEVS